jgi:hypothetical protein
MDNRLGGKRGLYRPKPRLIDGVVEDLRKYENENGAR